MKRMRRTVAARHWFSCATMLMVVGGLAAGGCRREPPPLEPNRYEGIGSTMDTYVPRRAAPPPPLIEGPPSDAPPSASEEQMGVCGPLDFAVFADGDDPSRAIACYERVVPDEHTRAWRVERLATLYARLRASKPRTTDYVSPSSPQQADACRPYFDTGRYPAAIECLLESNDVYSPHESVRYATLNKVKSCYTRMASASLSAGNFDFSRTLSAEGSSMVASLIMASNANTRLRRLRERYQGDCGHDELCIQQVRDLVEQMRAAQGDADMLLLRLNGTVGRY